MNQREVFYQVSSHFTKLSNLTNKVKNINKNVDSARCTVRVTLESSLKPGNKNQIQNTSTTNFNIPSVTQLT